MITTKLNNPHNVEKISPTPEKKGMVLTAKQKIAIFAISLAISAGIGGGIVAGAMNHEHAVIPTETEPTHPQSANSEMTVESTSETTAENTTETVLTDTELAMVRKIYAASEVMKKYSLMSIDEFRRQDTDEQLAYVQYVIDRTTSGGRYDAIYGEGEQNQSVVDFTPVSIDNSGQEIFDNSTFALQIAYLQIKVTDTGGAEFDLADCQKCLSFVFHDVGKDKIVSNSYSAQNTFMETLDEPIAYNILETITNTSDLLAGTDEDGNNIQYKVLTSLNDNNIIVEGKYIYHEFISYDGTRQATWLLDNYQIKN